MIDVTFESEAGLPAVQMDAGQIHQIVLNLVMNAAQAIGDVRGLIDVRVSTVDVCDGLAQSVPGLDARRYVVLSVRDDGPGMDPATLARIFEPFFTTKPPDEGIGIGQRGYRVSFANGPRQALERFTNDPASVAVVISDMRMPGMSGIELMREVRQARRDIPAILTSGFLSEEEVRAAERLRVRPMVTPAEALDDLGRIVTELLRERSAAGACCKIGAIPRITMRRGPAPRRAAEARYKLKIPRCRAMVTA